MQTGFSQILIAFGDVANDGANLLPALEAMIGECAVCGISIIGVGNSQWLARLAELCFAQSAAFVWIGASADAPLGQPAGFPIVAMPQGLKKDALDAACASARLAVTVGRVEPTWDVTDRMACVALGDVEFAAQAKKKRFPMLSSVMKQVGIEFTAGVAEADLKAAYGKLWYGYPSSDGDARTTAEALRLFRRAFLATLTSETPSTVSEEALVRLHEAAGSYHYYQRQDHGEAVRHFARGVFASDRDAATGRFIRALAVETIGLLAFDLGEYEIAAFAAEKARERYASSREDCSADVQFYFDHTIEGLSGDAEVYRAHHLAAIGETTGALEALARARARYTKALCIQPLWKTNQTRDTYGSSMEVLQALEERLDRAKK